MSARAHATVSEEAPLTFMQLFWSVLAAAFGVQTNSNRRRDFERGKPLHFIAIGIIFTTLFVVLMLVIVRVVLGLYV